jgi:prolipoprotein diacylglyceryltransferase
MKQNSYYIAIYALLIISAIVLTYYVYTRHYTREGFETEKELSDFHKQIVDDITSGKIDNVTISNYIKDGKVTKDDLDVIIKHLVNKGDK